MPPVGAAIAAITLADVVLFIGKILVSVALNAVFSAKPKNPGVDTRTVEQSLTITTVEPAAPWEVVYGELRKGGKIVFRHVTDIFGSAQAPVLTAVIPHTSPYTLTAPSAAEYVSTTSVVQTNWDGEDGYDRTTFTATGGAPAQGEYSVSAGVWTFNAADAGAPLEITYTKRNVDVAHGLLHLVIVLAAHECQEVGDIYFNDEVVPLDTDGNATGKYANHVIVKKHLGATDQTADATLVAVAADKWTTEHRLRGHTYIYVQLRKNHQLFQGAVPNITAIVRGRKVYDSRSAATVWTNNWALCQADYLYHATFGLGAAYSTEIDSTLLSAAANAADEEVLLASASATFTASATTDALTLAAGSRRLQTGDGVRVASSASLPTGLSAATTYYAILAAGGTVKLASSLANARAGTAIDLTSDGSGTLTLTYYCEPRYRCDGVIDTSIQPQEIIEKMLTAGAGRLVYTGGKWKVRAGVYITPTVTLDEGDARGPISVKTRRSRRDVFNAVKGLYRSPDNAWQPADFPPVVSATYYAEDQNERVWQEVDLPYTASGASAQRIAKIVLERVRRQITGAYPAKLNAYAVEPPETFMLTNTRFGYAAKVFEAMELKLVMDQDSEGNPIPGIDLAIQETDSAVYSWTGSSEETSVPAAPTTTLPDPSQVAPPGVPGATETLYETTGSAGVKTKATLTWTAAPQQQAWRYELEHKLKTDTTWIPNAGLINGTSAEVYDLAAGRYQFRVRTVSAIGVRSAWSQVEQELLGLSAPPAAVSGFSVSKIGGVALAAWTLHTDLDVRIGGRIVIRHSPLSSGATWNDGIILDEFNGDAVTGLVDLITGTYMAKALDSSGNYSSSSASFVVTEGMVTGFTTLATSTQHAAFTGAKTNVALDGTVIKLDSATLIDAMATSIDDWPYIDAIGGVSGTGSYAFTTYLDMATVATRRFESDITALSYDTGDTIDQRLDAIDSWGLFDGGVIDDCDVLLYAATTNDDPAGAPTWGDWTPFFVADFTCRAAKLKLDFVSGSSTHNIQVSALAVDVKVPT